MKNGLELLKQSLASGKVVDRPDALVSFEELHDIMGMHEIEELEQRYSRPSSSKPSTAAGARRRLYRTRSQLSCAPFDCAQDRLRQAHGERGLWRALASQPSRRRSRSRRRERRAVAVNHACDILAGAGVTRCGLVTQRSAAAPLF